MVLDRVNKIAYCARSERTNEELIDLFCEEMGYTSFVFSSFKCEWATKTYISHQCYDSIGLDFAMVCLRSIMILMSETPIDYFNKTEKRVLELSERWIQQFAGNAGIEIRQWGTPTALSSRGYHALTSTQVENYQINSKLFIRLCLQSNSLEEVVFAV